MRYEAERVDRGSAFDAESGCAAPDTVLAAKDMPALVACRAFAAQALWASGGSKSRDESCLMADQLCDQLHSLHSPTHVLLPSAALAIG